MARPKKAEKTGSTANIGFEAKLWQAADKLRNNMDAAEYKHVVLSLIFLKFASDKFSERREELVAEGKGEFVEMEAFYTMKNVFYLPEPSRWDFIKSQAKQDDFALQIDTALHTIEKSNPALAGALPDNYFSRLDLDRSKLASLIDEVSNINTIADKSQDVVGRVYEYFLGKFALAEGKGKGEFYTPKSIVKKVKDLIDGVYSEKSGKEAERLEQAAMQKAKVEDMSEKDIARAIKQLEKQMMEHARNLEFEKAAQVRDQLTVLKEQAFGAAGGDPIVPLIRA
jgi:type I restriction enzyme M protein